MKTQIIIKPPIRLSVIANQNSLSYLISDKEAVYLLGYIKKKNDTYVVYDQDEAIIASSSSIEDAVNYFFNLCSGVKSFGISHDMFNYCGLKNESIIMEF